MPKFKFSLTGLDGQSDYEYEYSYGNTDFNDGTPSTPSTPSTPPTPSTPYVDDSLREY